MIFLLLFMTTGVYSQCTKTPTFSDFTQTNDNTETNVYTASGDTVTINHHGGNGNGSLLHFKELLMQGSEFDAVEWKWNGMPNKQYFGLIEYNTDFVNRGGEGGASTYTMNVVGDWTGRLKAFSGTSRLREENISDVKNILYKIELKNNRATFFKQGTEWHHWTITADAQYRVIVTSDYGTRVSDMKYSCGPNTVNTNGGFSHWVDGPCNLTCGNPGTGVKTQTRRCSNPAPAGTGSTCSTATSQVVACDPAVLCPVDGGWTAWVAGTCVGPCGTGFQIDTRTCTNPAPIGTGSCNSIDGGNASRRVDCNKGITCGECATTTIPTLSSYTASTNDPQLFQVVEEVGKIEDHGGNGNNGNVYMDQVVKMGSEIIGIEWVWHGMPNKQYVAFYSRSTAQSHRGGESSLGFEFAVIGDWVGRFKVVTCSSATHCNSAQFSQDYGRSWNWNDAVVQVRLENNQMKLLLNREEKYSRTVPDVEYRVAVTSDYGTRVDKIRNVCTMVNAAPGSVPAGLAPNTGGACRYANQFRLYPTSICRHFSVTNAATDCPAGHVIVAGTATSDASCADPNSICAAGQYKTSAGACVAHRTNDCVAGQKYVAGTQDANADCVSCPDGQYSTTARATTCTAHTYATAAACTTAGTYFQAGTTTADSACPACAAGSFSAAGATTCTTHSATSCAAGTYTVPGTPTADARCDACAAGTYSDTTNAASCTAQIAASTCTNRQKYVVGSLSTASTCVTDTDLAAHEASGANLIKTGLGTCKDRGFQDSIESPNLDTATTRLTGSNLVIGVDVDAHATVTTIEMLDTAGTATVATTSFTRAASLTNCQQKYTSGNIAWDAFKGALKLYNVASSVTSSTIQYRAMLVVTTAAPYDPTVTRAAYAAMATPVFSAANPRRREVRSTFELLFNVPAEVTVQASLSMNSLPTFALQESVQLIDVRSTLNRDTLVMTSTFELLTKVNWPWRFASTPKPTIATSAQSTANQGSSSQDIAAVAAQTACADTQGSICTQGWLLTVGYTAGYCGANVGETITVTFVPENQKGTWTGAAIANTEAAIKVTDDLIQCSVQAGTLEVSGLLETFNAATMTAAQATLNFDIGSTAYFKITIPNLNMPNVAVNTLTLKEVSTQQAGTATPTFHYQAGANTPAGSTIVNAAIDTAADTTCQFSVSLASSIFDLAAFLGGSTVGLTINAVANIAYTATGAAGRRRRLLMLGKPNSLAKGESRTTLYISEKAKPVVCKDFTKKKQCKRSKKLKRSKKPIDGPCKWKKRKCTAAASSGPIKLQCKALKAKTAAECTNGCMAMHIGKKFKGCRGTYYLQG